MLQGERSVPEGVSRGDTPLGDSFGDFLIGEKVTHRIRAERLLVGQKPSLTTCFGSAEGRSPSQESPGCPTHPR